MSALSRLDALGQAHPEWTAWLLVLREIAPELSHPRWDAAVPPATSAAAPAQHLAPILAGAPLQPDGPALVRLWERLTSVARAQGLHAMAGETKGAPGTSADEALAIFMAALADDSAALDLQASRAGASPQGWRTLAQLLPMPYLHACARRWAANPARPVWSQGYCPVCGAWPAFAEVRGVERSRHLRCGRCGAGWEMPVLSCTYCATTDHDTLGTLVVEDRKSRFSVDVCHGCSGYLKSCTTLQPTPSDELIATDLESVEFDLAAVEHGFRRPIGPGAVLSASPMADPVSPSAPRG